MAGWVGDIEQETLGNEHFRRVVFTGRRMQMTVMAIAPGEEIGLEMHEDLDQFLRIEQGSALVTFGPSATEITERHEVADDWAIIVPGGTWHNVINTGDDVLKLYSLYSPPEHPDGTIHRDKAEADAAEAAEHGH